MTLDGLLLVDKPTGCTSHDVVQRVRRIVGQKRVGHCGTLDPGATGLLVLTLGRATRLTRFLIQAPKVYEGDIQFGSSTNTYDALGEITAEQSTETLTPELILAAMPPFVGTYEQTAPPFSAKKVAGRKHYELARRGEEVPEVKKEITVYSFDAVGSIDNARLSFSLACSSGTYVRTIAQDLGQATGFGAHLATLRRAKIGPFEASLAAALETLADAEDPTDGSWWIPFDSIPLPFAELVMESSQARRILHGQTVLVRGIEGEEGDWIKLLDNRRQFIAVGSISERIGTEVGIVQPRIVFS